MEQVGVHELLPSSLSYFNHIHMVIQKKQLYSDIIFVCFIRVY